MTFAALAFAIALAIALLCHPRAGRILSAAMGLAALAWFVMIAGLGLWLAAVASF
ncbi:MAG: hypothetical protein WBA25_10415 [Jannaschia sp.]